MHCAKSSAGNAHEADHLSFQLLKTHQVGRVLQHVAYTAVIFRSTENQSVSAFDLLPQSENVFGIFTLVFFPIAKDQLVVSKIDQRRLSANFTGAAQRDLQSHPRIATRAEAPANGHDPNLVSCLFVLGHVHYLRGETKPPGAASLGIDSS